MIEITAEIRAFIDKAAAGAELAEDEYASKRATCSALVSFANSLLVMERHPLWVAPLHLLTSSLCLYYTTNFVVCQ